MRERTEPEFVKFERAGNSIEGLLVRVEKLQVKDSNGRMNPAMRYTVDEGTRQVCFLGTYDINQKLRAADEDHWIKVTFKGESSNGNGNKQRLFSVMVSDETADAAMFGADA